MKTLNFHPNLPKYVWIEVDTSAVEEDENGENEKEIQTLLDSRNEILESNYLCQTYYLEVFTIQKQ
jgi:hypothetical protein